MTPGLYTIASALQARYRAQEVISNNLANADTLGFKRQVPAFFGFSTLLKQATEGPELEKSPGSGVMLSPPHFDLGPAALRTTGRELDFAIRGEGFFVVRTPGGEAFTRDGHFDIDANGRLVTSNGYPVLSRTGADITIPKGTVSTKNDGSVMVNGALAGTLRIEMPADPVNVVTGSGGLFFCEAGGVPAEAGATQFVNGVVEISNVNIPAELVTMLENSRLTETAAKGLQILDESLGKCISTLGA